MKDDVENFEELEKAFERIEDEESMILSDRFNLLLVAIEEKKGTDIEVFMDSEQELEEFLNFIDDLDLYHYVIKDPERTDLESLASFMDSEDNETREMLDREVITRIYVSKNEFNGKFFRRVKNPLYRKIVDYHWNMGDFYGFPEEDIKAYVYSKRPVWIKKIYGFLGRDFRNPILAGKAVEKYGEDLDPDEKKLFKAFTNHRIADTRESFERQLNKTKRIERKLENNGVDSEEYIEAMTFPDE